MNDREPSRYGDEDEEEPERQPKKWLVILAMIGGLILVGLCIFWALYDTRTLPPSSVFRRLAGLALYILIGHWVTPRPDYSNVGLLGGLIDRPFSLSDDANRLLILIKAVLFPGKLMAYGLIMGWHLLGHWWGKGRS